MRDRSAIPAQVVRFDYARRLRYAALATLLVLISMAALAEDVNVKLAGDQVVPPVTTFAKGHGTISINPDMTVTGRIMTVGIAATMAHIHVGAAGANGPIAIGLTRVGDGIWQVTKNSRLTREQYDAFKAGNLYVNVHSAKHKDGEIRGQLVPTAIAQQARAKSH